MDIQYFHFYPAQVRVASSGNSQSQLKAVKMANIRKINNIRLQKDPQANQSLIFLSEKSTINHKRYIIYPCRIFMYALQKLAFT